MKLKDAFAILKPKRPTYQALHNAHKDFQQQYADHAELLRVEQAAKDCLIEKDVYWLCPDDFERYTQDIASCDLIAEIRNVLQQVHALNGLVPALQGVQIVIAGPCEAVASDLQALGFHWKARKKRWTWRPSDMN